MTISNVSCVYLIVRRSKMDTYAQKTQVRDQAIDGKNRRYRTNNIYNWLASCLIILAEGIIKVA